jgi:phage repressor protein C with HTH and peptisase S24 domain/transcriptional regulator with XRE-family HTH domain
MPEKRTHPVTRAEIDKLDAENPRRLYKKKFASLSEELGEELAQKALAEWVEKQRAESRKQGGIMTVLPPDAMKMGRPKYVPILDKNALVELRTNLRVSAKQLSKRMKWEDYAWSRLENGAMNFTLERGIEIADKLGVIFQTLMLADRRAEVEGILDTYGTNLESNLQEQYIEDWIHEQGGADGVLESHGMDEDVQTNDDDQIWEWAADIAHHEIGNDWMAAPEWKALSNVREHIEANHDLVMEQYERFIGARKKVVAFWREHQKKMDNGELDILSADGAMFELKYERLLEDAQTPWRGCTKALDDGTLRNDPEDGTALRLEAWPTEVRVYSEWLRGASHKFTDEELTTLKVKKEAEHVPDDPRNEEMITSLGQPQQEVETAPAPPPQSASQLVQLPIYGSARAGSDSIDLDRGAAALSWTERPYFLAGVGNSYGCYVNSDSMYPVYSEGALLFVHPSKPVRRGDDCIVEVQKENEEPIGLVKRLISKSSDKFIFEQFNPPARIEFAASEIKTLHLVVGSLASGS